MALANCALRTALEHSSPPRHCSFCFGRPSRFTAKEFSPLLTMTVSSRRCQPLGLAKFPVVYADTLGCVHFCLPYFVDISGCCHSRPQQQNCEECSVEDLYLDKQLNIMREVEENKRLMNLVLEDLLQQAKEQRRVEVQAAIQTELKGKQSHGNGAAARIGLTRAQKDALLKEMLGLKGLAPPYKSQPLQPEMQPVNCSFSPRERKAKSGHYLQQPRAIY